MNMKKTLLYCSALLCLLLTASPLPAQDKSGCLKQGTLVLTPSGNVPVEQLKPGDAVISISRGTIKPARVQSVTIVQPDQYLQIMINNRLTLSVTQEHPLEVKFGIFRMVSALKTGDKVNIIENNKLTAGTVTSISRMPAQAPAYNLLVTPIGTYVANGIIVHNKGYFLPETPVLKTDGAEVPLSRIRQQDRVRACTAEGRIGEATVRKVLTHEVEGYSIVRAGDRIQLVTNEHPFYVGKGTFKTLEALTMNDSIYVCDTNGFNSRRIQSIETVRKKTRVFNLQTDAPHAYVVTGKTEN